jgi:hypothetical protein
MSAAAADISSGWHVPFNSRYDTPSDVYIQIRGAAFARRPRTTTCPAFWTQLRRSWTTWQCCWRLPCCSFSAAAAAPPWHGKRCRRVQGFVFDSLLAYIGSSGAAHLRVSAGCELAISSRKQGSERAAGTALCQHLWLSGCQPPPLKTVLAQLQYWLRLASVPAFAEAGGHRGPCCAGEDAAAAAPADERIG